jgi:hypothetical protein
MARACCGRPVQVQVLGVSWSWSWVLGLSALGWGCECTRRLHHESHSSFPWSSRGRLTPPWPADPVTKTLKRPYPPCLGTRRRYGPPVMRAGSLFSGHASQDHPLRPRGALPLPRPTVTRVLICRSPCQVEGFVHHSRGAAHHQFCRAISHDESSSDRHRPSPTISKRRPPRTDRPPVPAHMIPDRRPLLESRRGNLDLATDNRQPSSSPCGTRSSPLPSSQVFRRPSATTTPSGRPTTPLHRSLLHCCAPSLAERNARQCPGSV